MLFRLSSALNHCPLTREELRGTLQHEGLLNRVDVPEDGDTVSVEYP